MMKKILKLFFKILGAFLGFLLLIIVSAFLYALYNPDYDISPNAYHWGKNISDREVDRIARDLVGQMSLEEKVGQLAKEVAEKVWFC